MAVVSLGLFSWTGISREDIIDDGIFTLYSIYVDT